MSRRLAALSLVFDEAEANLEVAKGNLATIVRLAGSAIERGEFTTVYRQSLTHWSDQYLAAIDSVDAARAAFLEAAS